jgi:hypothetical protein
MASTYRSCPLFSCEHQYATCRVRALRQDVATSLDDSTKGEDVMGNAESHAKMVKMQAFVLAAVCAVVVNVKAADAGTCQFDTIPNLTFVQYGTSPWTTFCGHTITGSGSGGCTATVPAGSGPFNVASGDCLTLGSGVDLDLGGNTINCTGTNCGAAIINTNSGSSSAAVKIKNGTVTGCWSDGVVCNGGTNSTVSAMTLDGSPTGAACTRSLNAGLHSVRGTISRCTVSGWLSGIYLYPGEDVNDCSVYGNYVGIDNVGATSAVSNVYNDDLHANGYAFKNVTGGTYKPKVQSSSIADDGGACNCIDGSLSCINNITDCVNFGTTTTSGDTSFVEGQIFP